MSLWKTTTPSFTTHSIAEYKGIVSGQAVLGTNALKDLFAGMADSHGGRAKGYEKDLAKARSLALADMEMAAQSLGANGIVGIDCDYQVLGQKNNMLMVTVTGTAVIVQ